MPWPEDQFPEPLEDDEADCGDDLEITRPPNAVDCPECNGTGETICNAPISGDDWMNDELITCWKCDGRGWIIPPFSFTKGN